MSGVPGGKGRHVVHIDIARRDELWDGNFRSFRACNGVSYDARKAWWNRGLVE